MGGVWGLMGVLGCRGFNVGCMGCNGGCMGLGKLGLRVRRCRGVKEF